VVQWSAPEDRAPPHQQVSWSLWLRVPSGRPLLSQRGALPCLCGDNNGILSTNHCSKTRRAHDKDDAEIENFRRLHRLPSSIVTGTYVLPSVYGPSAPLVGASVRLTSPSGQRFTAKTDADGGFTFSGLLPATYQIQFDSTWLRRGLGSKFGRLLAQQRRHHTCEPARTRRLPQFVSRRFIHWPPQRSHFRCCRLSTRKTARTHPDSHLARQSRRRHRKLLVGTERDRSHWSLSDRAAPPGQLGRRHLPLARRFQRTVQGHELCFKCCPSAMVLSRHHRPR